MNFLEVYKHLLSDGKAWALSKNKQLREFFEGLSRVPENVKSFYDLIFSDLLPLTTRELEAWEKQFNLPGTGSDADRRARLDARWKEKGGQDPRYLQDTLQAAGFNVYIHEWWEPGTEPALNVKTCATPRNPSLYIYQPGTSALPAVACGEPLSLCGEPGALSGETLSLPTGYSLVNKIGETLPEYFALCGIPTALAGESDVLCGNFNNYVFRRKQYNLPTDPNKWPYFVYYGGPNFPDVGYIPAARRDEFEDLLLKINPLQLWIGVLVEFTLTANRALLDGETQLFRYPLALTAGQPVISFEFFGEINNIGSSTREIFRETRTSDNEARVSLTLSPTGELILGMRDSDAGPLISTTSTGVLSIKEKTHILCVINSLRNTLRIFVGGQLFHDDTSQTFGPIMSGASFAASSIGGGDTVVGRSLSGEISFFGVYNTDKSGDITE